eukprot:2388783-Prymnesium_polylepis.2
MPSGTARDASCGQRRAEEAATDQTERAVGIGLARPEETDAAAGRLTKHSCTAGGGGAALRR